VKLTQKQEEAQKLLADIYTHLMLFGGSRSGKTFLLVRNVVTRAIKAPGSRHLIARYRLNHIKSSVVLDTFPKVMKLAFPNVEYELNKTDLYVTLPNGSEIWFAGLDDSERVEKILGNEYVTIYLNECSQISWAAVGMVATRLAQKVMQVIDGKEVGYLKPRMYYDCNPPKKSHWTYKVFIVQVDPETGEPLNNKGDYASFQINPKDNEENLSGEYIKTLEGLSERLKRRFLSGNFSDDNPNQLFKEDDIDKWRCSGDVPDMVRIVVGVDPSGSDDEDNADNDEIGIIVGGLGTDGNAYLLEDCTVKAGPGTWGKVATAAFDRHKADVIVGEQNYGGAMVKFVIQTARPRTNYKIVTATRGKVVRAEPFSSLYEQGKCRHNGHFSKLEDELTAFSTVGYTGEKSPNRADAWIWVLTELFPGLVKAPKKKEDAEPKLRTLSMNLDASNSWMS
jgi:hypothetical protein